MKRLETNESAEKLHVDASIVEADRMAGRHLFPIHPAHDARYLDSTAPQLAPRIDSLYVFAEMWAMTVSIPNHLIAPRYTYPRIYT